MTKAHTMWAFALRGLCMALSLAPEMVAHGIQLSVAPVFLLTAVSGMIGAVAQRLARIIDRARVIEKELESTPEGQDFTQGLNELLQLRRRGLLANGCIALLTACAFLIGVTIVILFLGETIDFQMQRAAVGSFLSGVMCFLLALVCFMLETWIATKLLKFNAIERWR